MVSAVNTLLYLQEMRKGMKKKNRIALIKPSYASKLAAAQKQKGRVTLERRTRQKN